MCVCARSPEHDRLDINRSNAISLIPTLFNVPCLAAFLSIYLSFYFVKKILVIQI